MLVFVTGLSGSGKTTLGEQLKSKDGFAHFNVDVWAFGGDPLLESNSVPGPEMMKNRDPAIKEAFDNMIANGFGKLSKGEEVEFSAWENFFSLLCPAVLAAQSKLPTNTNLVVSFSVYLEKVRDYLRQHLSNDIRFIILNPSIEHVAIRKVNHLKNTAAERGQTLSQFLRSFHPDSDAPDMEESVLIGILTEQARGGSVGFQGKQAGEANTLEVGDKTADEVYEAAHAFLNQA